MNKKIQIIFLITLISLLILINYSWLDNFLIKNFENINKEDFNVKRIIDGDTIVVGDNLTVRLLGVNCPEKGEKYYEEAKEFLEKEIFNKIVFIKSFGKDIYYRELGVVFFENENVNVKLVKKGLANVYILENKIYEKELKIAWEGCLEEGKNLCRKSEDKCAECVELKKLDFKNQEVVFYNKCDFDCDLDGWTIKDEGRKKFIFENFILEGNKKVNIKVGEGINQKDILFWEGEDYVWTSTGDTLFLRDKENDLVLWESY